MIVGNPVWNQHIAAATTNARPLYTFEIPDEGLIITSFIPEEANVTVDTDNLVAQPLWFLAAVKAAALTSVTLIPTMGFLTTGDDGSAYAVPPVGEVVRYSYGAGVSGAAAVLSWHGIAFPPGMQDVRRAISMDLVMLSTLTESGSYFPYGSVGYAVTGIPAELTTWHSALLDNTHGWVNRTDILRLWPGNADVGATMPDINKIQVQISQVGTTTGVDTNGAVFTVQPTLLLGFV